MKQINLTPGRYIIAVSGGVDSMVLLDMARGLPGVELIVAHVDHGIRPDSHMDRALVERVAMSHNLVFECTQLRLDSWASEDMARQARYNFLRHTQAIHGAVAILTAHHKDDLLETAILNMARGTGWRGLSSLRSKDDMVRPLLDISKEEIIRYAQEQGIAWRDDSTNVDPRYARNYIRHRVLARAPTQPKEKMQEIIVRQNHLVESIEQSVAIWLEQYATQEIASTTLPRYQIIMMSEHVAHEVFQTVLRQKGEKSLPRPQVSRMVLFAKVAKAGKVMSLDAHRQLRATRREVIVEPKVDVVSLGNVRGTTRTPKF